MQVFVLFGKAYSHSALLYTAAGQATSSSPTATEMQPEAGKFC